MKKESYLKRSPMRIIGNLLSTLLDIELAKAMLKDFSFTYKRKGDPIKNRLFEKLQLN